MSGEKDKSGKGRKDEFERARFLTDRLPPAHYLSLIGLQAVDVVPTQ